MGADHPGSRLQRRREMTVEDKLRIIANIRCDLTELEESLISEDRDSIVVDGHVVGRFRDVYGKVVSECYFVQESSE